MKVKFSDKRMEPLTKEQLATLSKEDLLVVLEHEMSVRQFLQERVNLLQEEIFEVNGKFFRIRSKVFARSSERSAKNKKDKKNKGATPRRATSKLPSERYPNAEIIEKHITCEELPTCDCCGKEMQDSGMTEVSEYLTVIPKQYIVVRQHRHKYRCGSCHGDIVTTPSNPRVIPGSSYSDEVIVDATLSKFCDLIPMERYCQMAGRQGFPGLPPQSLIGTTIRLAEFLKEVYERLRKETLATRVLFADETTHNMLEGDETSGWYLWGFLARYACFYECHNTRSGDVASAVLQNSDCEVLLTDVYSGYKKAVRLTNEKRLENKKSPIQVAYCNSHARRGFTPNEQDAEAVPEAKFMLDKYQEIYKINKDSKDKSHEKILELRAHMRPFFEEMKTHAEKTIKEASNKSAIARSFNYFLNNYDGLTLFLTNPLVPIDNNPSERLLRSPVVGRKTWYGTHSKDGAETAAIHFSLVEACKLNRINPRAYYAAVIKAIQQKKPIFTPKEFFDASKEQHSQNSS